METLQIVKQIVCGIGAILMLTIVFNLITSIKDSEEDKKKILEDKNKKDI